MLICVTNRRLCTDDFSTRLAKIAPLVDAVVLREKDISPEEYSALAQQIRKICAPTPLILHTFPDIAAQLQCPIQLPFDRFQTSNLHAVSRCGVSIHSVEEAQLAEKLGASWLIAGHIFTTGCKPNLPARGLDFLRHVCDSVSIPVFAIGGITPETIAQIRETGAPGACVMSDWMQCENVATRIDAYRRAWQENGGK